MVRQLAARCTILGFGQSILPETKNSGKNPVQVPAAVWFVFTEGPECAAMGVAHDEVVAAAVATIPPAAFDALGTGEYFIPGNIAAFGPGQ